MAKEKSPSRSGTGQGFFRMLPSSVVVSPGAPSLVPRLVGGINLPSFDPFGPALFANVFRGNELWEFVDAVGFGANSGTINTDGDGYFTETIPHNDGDGDCVPQTHVGRFEAGLLPSGTYTLRFTSGAGGTVMLAGDAAGTFENVAGGEFEQTVSVTATSGGITIRIMESDPANKVRNIRLLMPGVTDDNAINPQVLSRMASLNGPVRFLNRVNGSDQEVWADRTSPTYYAQTTGNGAAWEYHIDLCNALQLPLWVNVPHKVLGGLATPDLGFVNALCDLILERLDSGLDVYWEYSNEAAWNTDFSQTTWLRTVGAAMGFSGSAAQQGRKLYAKRSAELFGAVLAKFAGQTSRCSFVVSGQQSQAATVGEEVLTYFASASIDGIDVNPAAITAHHYGIAPYAGNGLADALVTNGELTIPVDDILDRLTFTYLANTKTWITQSKAKAAEHGVGLIAYEGGLSAIGTGANVNNATLTALMLIANRHPRIYRIVRALLDHWVAQGGGPFCLFHFADDFTGGDMFGAMEYIDQPLAEAHKWRALVDGIAATADYHNPARRTTGVGPLGVLFDLSLMASLPFPADNGSGKPAPDVEHYSWNFGKSGAGTHANNGRSKNADTGWCAACEYEPGTYEPELTVIRADGAVAVYNLEPIVVSVFSGPRRYVNTATGDDNYDGSSPVFTGGTTGPWRTATKALSATGMFALSSCQCTFKCDQEPEKTSTTTITNKAGPYIIDNDGTGANPIIRPTVGSIDGVTSDANVTDLRWIGVDLIPATLASGRTGVRPGTDWTFHRCTINNIGSSISISDAHGTRSGNGFFECTLGPNNTSYPMFYETGQHVMVIGCDIPLNDADSTEHNMRFWLPHSAVKHNHFSGGNTGKTMNRQAGYYPLTGLTNDTFTSNANGWLEETGPGAFRAVGTSWVWEAPGRVRHIAGNTHSLTQPITNLTVGEKRPLQYGVIGRTVGSVQPFMGTGAGTSRTADGNYIGLDATSGIICATDTILRFTPSSDFDGAIDFDPANFTARPWMDTNRSGSETHKKVEYTCIEYNVYDTMAATVTTPIQFGTTNSGDDMWMENCTFRYNTIVTGSGVTNAIDADSVSYMTFESNVFILSASSSSVRGVRLRRSGAGSPALVGNKAIFNTGYYAGSYGANLIDIDAANSGATAVNNWMVRGSGAGGALADAGSGTTKSNNVVSTTGMVNPPSDVRPDTGSAAIDAAVTRSESRVDFNGLARHATLPDAGAYEKDSVLV